MSRHVGRRPIWAYFVIALAFFLCSIVFVSNHGPARHVLQTICTSSGVCKPTEEAPLVPLRGKSLRIMAVGDSVTMGPLGTSSYRENLVKLLHGNTVDMVGNVGWGTMKPSEMNRLEAGMAMTIEQIHSQLKESLPKWRPNVVLVHLGTNDVAWKQELATAPERLVAAIETIVEDCPDAAVIVTQILPIGFRGDEVKFFNSELEKIVSNRFARSRVLLIDMHTAFETQPHPNYFADISHPNAIGYHLMAQEWCKAMEKANGMEWIEEPVEWFFEGPPIDNRVHS